MAAIHRTELLTRQCCGREHQFWILHSHVKVCSHGFITFHRHAIFFVASCQPVWKHADSLQCS